MSFSVYLRPELKQRGWSGRTLALKAGIGTNTVSRAIRGDGIPQPDTIHKMATALELDQRLLLGLAGHLDSERPVQLDPAAVQIAQRLSVLPDPMRVKTISAFGSMLDAMSMRLA